MTEDGLHIEIRILDERLREWGLPAYQSAGAAAVDLHACIDEAIDIGPGEPARLVSAGFSMHIANPGIAAMIVPRSGHGHKLGLVMGNTVGLIDSDYNGPVFVSAWNRNRYGKPITIEPGMRLAQMVFVPVLRPTLAVVEDFSATTDRGEGGFGSTG